MFVGDLVSIIYECVPDLNMYYRHTCVLCRENTYRHMHLSLLLKLFRFQFVLNLTKQKYHWIVLTYQIHYFICNPRIFFG